MEHLLSIINQISDIVSFGAMIGMTTTTFVSLLSQPKIFTAIADDGLLWPFMKKTDPKTQVATTSTFITGGVVILFATFLKFNYLASSISIACLLAYGCVSLGLLTNRYRHSTHPNIRFAILVLLVISSLSCGIFFTCSVNYAALGAAGVAVVLILGFCFIEQSDIPNGFKCPLVPVLPCLSTFSNFFMMGTVDLTSWSIFVIFMIIGVIIYFTYSQKHSNLNNTIQADTVELNTN